MITSIRLQIFILAAIAFGVSLAGSHQALSQQPAAHNFAGMRWRLIGPFRGGRAIAVAGVPNQPNEYYFGAVGGGVWKTLNAGRTWEPIFDSQPISSIGAIAVAASDPQIIYVGSGEADMRSDISYGDGVYKSADGGATWKNIGLRDTEQIGRVLVDPHDPNIVLVAALGHGYGPNSERGVYRSTDGGATWTKVLSKNDDTGAIDLAFDPDNSRVVYASLWQARRPPWASYPPAGGPGSGLYKSTDGGVTWAQIVGHGFPSDGLGRIGIAVASGGTGNRVYAIVDARDGGLYRSDDAGQNWRRMSSDHRIWQRGWYFGGVTADPRDPNVVYVPNTALYRSTDGGASFVSIKGAPGGDDYHQLWIATDDPQRMVLGSDQGVVVSVDGGATWSSWYNQPTAQIYHLTTDNRFPYRVYGTQQDSGTASVVSRSDYGQITFRDWSPVGGNESGYIALDSSRPNVVYGGGPFGAASRFDWTTGQSADIAPWPSFAPGRKLRFNWNAPLVSSPQEPHVLYFAAQYVFRTVNGGSSWETISPDLTKRPGLAKQRPHADAAQGKNEDRGVVYTIAPSPVRAGEIWAGSDNGVIQITADEGKSWKDVTPSGLADWSMVSLIEASHYDAATAYAAVDRHQVDDFHPYIYRTHDSGKTWQNVVDGLPARAYVHVVREDPKRKGLLFAGTEIGIFTSFDDGGHWRPLQLNLPVSPIYDIAVHGDDLAVATHGRSFWILDDIEPLRESSQQIDSSDAHLFHPADVYRIRRSENHDTPLPPETPVGQNPPAGAIVDYQLKSNVAAGVVLEIRNSQGRLVRSFSSNDKPPAPTDPLQFPNYWLPKPQILSNTAGMHRFIWDLRYAQPAALHYGYSMGAQIHGGTEPEPQGPLVMPGEYEARLIVNSRTYKQTFSVVMDPRVRVSQEDLQKQLAFELEVDAALTKATGAQNEIRNFRVALDALKKQVSHSKDLADSLEQADQRAESLAGSEGQYPPTSVGISGIAGALTTLAASAGTADAAPTAQSLAAFAEFKKLLDEKLTGWETTRRHVLPDLNQKLKAVGIAPIVVSDR